MHFHFCGNLFHDLVVNTLAVAGMGTEYVVTLAFVLRSVYYDLVDEYTDTSSDRVADAAANTIERLLRDGRHSCAEQCMRLCDGLDSPRINQLRARLGG